MRRAVSEERLGSYRLGDDEKEEDALARYARNTDLSEALYPSLQALEVALRNAMHAAVAERFENELWFYLDDPPILKERERSKAEEAKREFGRRGKTVTPGRIVAELNFGFWTSLFDRRYEQVLWPHLLRDVFPHAPRRRLTRKALAKRLNDVRRLRNRVFHHEAIWHRQDLRQKHGDIVETVDWLSPAAADLLRLTDRFPEVYERGLDPYRKRLAELLDDPG